MPAVSRKNDEVFSPDGSGRKCRKPVIASVDEVNTKNVYVNGKLVPVYGNRISPHRKRGCTPDTSTLNSVSTTVFIGGMGIGRINDKYGNNVIIEGSPNVFSG